MFTLFIFIKSISTIIFKLILAKKKFFSKNLIVLFLFNMKKIETTML